MTEASTDDDFDPTFGFPVELADFAKAQHVPLDPELAKYIDNEEEFPVLRHPLVYSIGVAFPGMLNKALEKKRKRLARAIEEKDASTIVFLHERPWRYDALIEYNLTKSPEHTQLIGEVWTDSENVWQNLPGWMRLLHSVEPEHRHLLMNETDRWTWENLPDEVTVYRGACWGRNESGLSWTLDEAMATWFAVRLDADAPVVVTGKVRKRDVIAYYSVRNEDEIVALPARVRFKKQRGIKRKPNDDLFPRRTE